MPELDRSFERTRCDWAAPVASGRWVTALRQPARRRLLLSTMVALCCHGVNDFQGRGRDSRAPGPGSTAPLGRAGGSEREPMGIAPPAIPIVEVTGIDGAGKST